MLSLQAFKIDAEEMSHAQCISLNVHSLKKKKKRKNHKISHGHMIAHHNNINNNTRNSKDDTKLNTNNNNNHDNDSNHGFNNVVNMNVPPGFRFHPTDEELISFYLTNKVMVVDPMAAPADITNFDLHRVIPEVDLNKLEPWDLYEKCKVSSASHQTTTAGVAAMPATEWYFFSHKDKKYPTGTRTNRATAAGFWKATGRDKAVHSVTSRRSIGMRKTLVFYRGRAPHGTKTDWIMHEYRLEDKDYEPKCNEDGWVVCRVFKKRCLQDKEATRHSNSNMSDEESPLTYPQGKKRHKKDSDEIETTVTNNIPIIAHLPCKLEVMEDLPPLQPAFFQLPQLQSCSEIADSTLSIPMENHNKNMVNQPPSLCSDLDPEECDDEDEDEDEDDDDNINSYSNNNKPFFMSEDELASFIYNGHFPDGWSMYDTMGRYNPELCSFPIDLPQTLYFSKMQPPPIEYPSNCDVDLWNFTR